jgi:hypothetical protein
MWAATDRLMRIEWEVTRRSWDGDKDVQVPRVVYFDPDDVQQLTACSSEDTCAQTEGTEVKLYSRGYETEETTFWIDYPIDVVYDRMREHSRKASDLALGRDSPLDQALGRASALDSDPED